MKLEKSHDWWERAGNVLAGGFATLSKNPDRFPFGVSPIVLHSGDGCHVMDVDGNTFLDTIASLGPVLFGYRWAAIDEAVVKAIQTGQGPAFSLGHHVEIEVAEMLAANIMAIDAVRFCKNGADACQAAVRVARSATDRRHILACGYHGHHDWYISTTDKRGGVLPEIAKSTHQFEWGNDEQFDNLIAQYGHDMAGVIIEVPPLPWSSGSQNEDIKQFLEYVQRTASRWDVVFILDEIVTGFRHGLGGASALYGVTPDLICLGKGMANGWALAAIGGDKNLMNEFRGGNVFLSTTNGGEVMPLIAAKACMLELDNPRYLSDLWDSGRMLGNGLQKLIKDHNLPVELLGNEARMVMKWKDVGAISGDAFKTLWLQIAISQGVLFGGPIFPTVSMRRQDVNHVLDIAEVAALTIKHVLLYGGMEKILHCPIIEDVFSKRYRPFDSSSALSGV